MSKKRPITTEDSACHEDPDEDISPERSTEEDPSCAKSRRIDNDITTSSIFASITNSDDEADSSFEVISGEDRTEEPYMSQLRTPPHDNSETIDGSLDLLDGLHRSSTRNISIADQDDEDNEEESGGGSSAASTAADIMREMLEEFPRSNDTLVINSREESDEEQNDQDFQYNEKFEMLLQDDASPSLPHGFDVDTTTTENELMDMDNDASLENENRHTNILDKETYSNECDTTETRNLRENNLSTQPPLPITKLPPLPADNEKRPPSPPLDRHRNKNSSNTSKSQMKPLCSNMNTLIENVADKNVTITPREGQIENELMGMGDPENEELEDELSDIEDLLDADLDNKTVPAEAVKGKTKEPHEKTRSYLVDRGKNHFTVLPEGWIQVRHNSGIPVYLHKQTRVVALSKPYVLGPHSVRAHHIPLGSIPCLNYRKAKEEEESLRSKITPETEIGQPQGNAEKEKENILEEKDSESNKIKDHAELGPKKCPFNPSKQNEGNKQQNLSSKFPMAKISSAGETRKAKSLSPDELKKYCSNLFEFREVKVKSFPNWKQKRLYNKELNANRLKELLKKSKENIDTTQKDGKNLEESSLPDFKLITIPQLEMQKNDEKSQDNTAFNRKVTKKTKKEWIFNPKNKTPVCILHEFLQHSIRQPPDYEYQDLESAKTPYSATVIVDGIKYGTGYGTSKKQAKSEAAHRTLEVLIPNFKNELGSQIQGGSSSLNEVPDVTYFDTLRVEDPRVSDLCTKIGEPSPYAILIQCLTKNYGLGDTNIQTDLKPKRNKKNEFIMKVQGKEVRVICKNKKDGKQMASQKILRELHPQIQSWGALLRLYGSTAIQAQKLKKEKESEVTVLQSRHSDHPSPSQAILEKLKEEMRKLSARKKDALPIGKLTVPGTFLGANYGAIGVTERTDLSS